MLQLCHDCCLCMQILRIFAHDFRLFFDNNLHCILNVTCNMHGLMNLTSRANTKLDIFEFVFPKNFEALPGIRNALMYYSTHERLGSFLLSLASLANMPAL